MAVASMLHGVVAADDDPINTERPSFSSSPVALAPGRYQLEGGYLYADDAIDAHILPLALVRVGLVERWELQVNWAGISRNNSGPGSSTDSGDLGVGVKWQLTNRSAAIPAALFVGVSLPTGNGAIASDNVDPTMGLFWSYASTLNWFGTATLGEFDGDTILSNGIGINFPINPRTGSFVEFVSRFPDDGGPAHVLNSGITVTPVPNLQWDVHAGIGLNDNAPDVVVGAGVAYRF